MWKSCGARSQGDEAGDREAPTAPAGCLCDFPHRLDHESRHGSRITYIRGVIYKVNLIFQIVELLVVRSISPKCIITLKTSSFALKRPLMNIFPTEETSNFFRIQVLA